MLNTYAIHIYRFMEKIKYSSNNTIKRLVKNYLLPHKLKIISAEPMEIRCSYCGKNQDINEIVDFII